jgi:hypothetical protein
MSGTTDLPLQEPKNEDKKKGSALGKALKSAFKASHVFVQNLYKADPDDDTDPLNLARKEILREHKDRKEKEKAEGTTPAKNVVLLDSFRLLVGIESPEGLHDEERQRQNIGIYSRVIQGQQSYHKQHTTYSLLINGALGLQIVVAAALTAIGAGKGPHKAVILFGAINTVIASFLAYLKGSGLPNRLKYYEDEYRKIREHIEQCERQFCRKSCELVPRDEVARIARMYFDVKGDVEANTPDGFVSVAQIVNRKAARPTNNVGTTADDGGPLEAMQFSEKKAESPKSNTTTSSTSTQGSEPKEITPTT